MATTPKQLSSLASYAPFAASLAELAARYPGAADLVLTVVKDTVDRGLRLGPTDPQVWARAFQAAVRQFTNRRFADEWTKAIATRGRSVAARFQKTKGDVERAR